MVQGLKNITKEYYDDYIKVLSNIKKKKEKSNYIENDIFDFVKKFVKNTKEAFDLDSFIQSKEESDLDSKKEDPTENSKDKKYNLDQDYVYLIKGDALLDEKNEKKGKKKTSSEKIY